MIFLIVVVLTAATGCTSGADDGDGVSIVVTTNVWGDVVEAIVGDDATVEVLIPVGADAHDYTASSRQVAGLQLADLVVANGLGLEEGLADALAAASDDGANVLELAPLLAPLPLGDADHDEDHDEEGHEGDDPHVWMDPDRVAAAVVIIAEALASLAPEVDWMDRALDYQARVIAAGQEADAVLADIPDARRKLVTNHDALGYFAERFRFEVIGVVIPGGSTLADPSSSEIRDLVATMEAEGVTTIFAETSSSTVLAETVAAEMGDDVAVVELYTGSLGEPGSGADSVLGMIETNARLVADALR